MAILSARCESKHSLLSIITNFLDICEIDELPLHSILWGMVTYRRWHHDSD